MAAAAHPWQQGDGGGAGQAGGRPRSRRTRPGADPAVHERGVVAELCEAAATGDLHATADDAVG